VNYFVMVFFNVALVGVANSRLMGGTWTFRDGIELAWERKGAILQWALVAATVGVVLRTLEERLGLIGRLIMRIIGIVWTLACYFVVPVLAFEDLTPVEAVKRSSKLFRDTWGEKVVGGFSLSLVSMVLMLPGIGLWLAAMFLGGIKGLLVGTVLMIIYFLLLSVFMSAVGGIFTRRSIVTPASSRCRRLLIMPWSLQPGRRRANLFPGGHAEQRAPTTNF